MLGSRKTVAVLIAVVALLTMAQKCEEAKLKIYPNPAQNVINIEKMDHIGEVELFNYQGNSVKKIVNPSNPIDISELPRGFYLVKAIVKEKNFLVTGKFVKE